MFPPMSETKLPEGPEHEVLYTIKEAAGFLRVYHKRIYDWAYEGKIKTVKLGRARRVPASEISRLMRDGFDT